ncbi:M10 family metallopeptidase C-terminal domain-containing protein, partial [Sphingomonas sp. LT1P40]|uniref:M10 family metallopeptidase C-terminal domain-containing protein n=1 Tax=Alteristakelama amylovorans TaxID=3096166 RepID=UPI003B563AB4
LQRGPVGDSNSFDITLDDSLVADDGRLTIWGYPLLTSLRVDGSAEAGGDLRIYGGAVGDNLIGGGGDDWLWGGAGGDRLTGGAGRDIFAYDVASQSTGINFDTLVGFDATQDRIDLPFAVTSVAAPVSGSLSLATFNEDLAAAIGAAQMASGQAVLFTAVGGDMDGQTFLIVNGLNSAAGYQNGSDYVFHLESPVSTIITPDPFV